jgi:hypothetical protein
MLEKQRHSSKNYQETVDGFILDRGFFSPRSVLVSLLERLEFEP